MAQRKSADLVVTLKYRFLENKLIRIIYYAWYDYGVIVLESCSCCNVESKLIVEIRKSQLDTNL